mmetsp:Transcript_34156/g.108564  ORF Transcript_34156/g.108564 Transcript_34156/m.108564 type:complete len:229 (+) Transcript_34156:70-756(+)
MEAHCSAYPVLGLQSHKQAQAEVGILAWMRALQSCPGGAAAWHAVSSGTAACKAAKRRPKPCLRRGPVLGSSHRQRLPSQESLHALLRSLHAALRCLYLGEALKQAILQQVATLHDHCRHVRQQSSLPPAVLAGARRGRAGQESVAALQASTAGDPGTAEHAGASALQGHGRCSAPWSASSVPNHIDGGARATHLRLQPPLVLRYFLHVDGGTCSPHARLGTPLLGGL